MPSTEWQEHKRTLARILDDDATWDNLASVYHNIRSLKARVIIDGPNAPIPANRLPELARDAKAAEDLSAALKTVATGLARDR